MLDMAKEWRTCTKCDEAKSLLDFPLYDTKRGKRRHECEACYKLRHKRHYSENRPDRLAKARKRYSYDPAIGWTPERRAQVSEAARIRAAKYRDQVIDMYGAECVACGETERLFLTIDHIKNDGWRLRKENYREAGAPLYLDIVRHGKRDDLEVLCFNCNFGKNRNGGLLVKDRRADGRCNDHPERE